jgi:hypothetical protein
MSNLDLQAEYRLYLLCFMTQDFETMIDSEVMSYDEWLADKNNKYKSGTHDEDGDLIIVSDGNGRVVKQMKGNTDMIVIKRNKEEL